MIDSHQASSALAEVADIGRRVRQSQFYQHSSSMLTLWGALTFVGYIASFLAPRMAGYIWIAIYVVGIAGSVAVGAITASRKGVHTFDARIFSAFVVFILFGCGWSVGLGHFGPRQLGAFWTTYFMLPYVMIGLWLGRAFVAIGLGVTTLTLIGYFFVGAWFDLWMAFANGCGLMLGGLWMRRS